jgi:putative ABC transport system ATP-binding protein
MDALARLNNTHTTVALHIQSLTKHYQTDAGVVAALEQVSLNVPNAYFLAIMGPSGSGKSTLLHCAAGLDRPTSGTVLIGDLHLETMSEKQLTIIRRERIGFVFQAFNLLPSLTVAQNIQLPLRLAKRKLDKDWYDKVVSTIGLVKLLERRPAALSGGQQQRVAIARALVTKPEVIFADEPTGQLDTQAGHDVLQLLRQATRAMGQTVVMVSHDPVAASFSDRVVFLADGKIVGDMTHPTTERIAERIAQTKR